LKARSQHLERGFLLLALPANNRLARKFLLMKDTSLLQYVIYDGCNFFTALAFDSLIVAYGTEIVTAGKKES